MKKDYKMPMFMPFQMENLELARAYVIDQPYIGMFPLSEAFKKGSLFPNLYKPYEYE